MRDSALSHLGDAELLRDLHQIAARDRSITAALLAHLAEVESRRLYAPAGYPSMEAYCIHELRFSEDVAHKRIRAARYARDYPGIFAMLADGRLNLSAVLLLGPWLRPGNAEELLAAAAGKTRFELEELIAERFPRTEVLSLVVPMSEQTAPVVPELSCQVAPGPPVAHRPRNVAPIAKDRYVLQLAISRDTQEKLEYAQALMSHVAGRDPARVFDRALDVLIAKLEKTRCGAASRPRAKRRASSSRRHIPAPVKRAVWQRDGGRCTYTTGTGQRCPARHLLQYDHIDPVARGGQATVENLRLRCATHNRLEAERTFGAGFVAEKRAAAQSARAGADERTQRAGAHGRASRTGAQEGPPHAEAPDCPSRVTATPAAATDPERDVTPWLRQLGCRPEHIRLAAEHCETLPEATSLEDRVRAAIQFMGRRRYPRAFQQQATAPGPAG